MKVRLLKLSLPTACAALILPGLTMAAHAAPSKPSTNTAPQVVEIPKSVFVPPTSIKEGRDPFFPNSTRRQVVAASTTGKSVSAAETMLDLKGFSGVGNNRLAIINNRTLGVGDVADIMTQVGRVRIKCVAIKEDSVFIEIGGEHRELKFRTKR